tara:strand:- start:143 stop:610 length:468 start_codon:yes stop_codon:yes gene_type:complete
MDINYELISSSTKILRGDGSEGYYIMHLTDGKWMLFYDQKEIDEKWKHIKLLYRDGQLSGIVQMKCSTIYKNPRASGDKKIIILYCEPEKNEEHIKNIGKNILNLMKYSDKIYYKTNNQTKLGTRATGQTGNHKYSISCLDNYILCSSSDESDSE